MQGGSKYLRTSDGGQPLVTWYFLVKYSLFLLSELHFFIFLFTFLFSTVTSIFTSLAPASHATLLVWVCNCLQESSQSFSSSWCQNLALLLCCAVPLPCLPCCTPYNNVLLSRTPLLVPPERVSLLLCRKGARSARFHFFASHPPNSVTSADQLGRLGWGPFLIATNLRIHLANPQAHA